MLVETFGAIGFGMSGYRTEHYTSPETWDVTMYVMFALYVIWILLWVFTIVYAIQYAQVHKRHNRTLGLLVSLISWPFYWIFKWTRVLV